jgi:hypothetical protein
MAMPDFWFDKIYRMGLREINSRFPVLARGSCRRVYDIGGSCVAKAATNREGFDQCRTEEFVYRNERSSLRRYLCPVLWYRPGMLIMAKAIPVIPLDRVSGDPYMDFEGMGMGPWIYGDLRHLSNKYGLLYEDLLSVTAWGYMGGNLMLIDYGCRG